MSTSNRILKAQQVSANLPTLSAAPVVSSLIGEMVYHLTDKLGPKMGDCPLDGTDVLSAMREQPIQVIASGEEIKEDLEGNDEVADETAAVTEDATEAEAEASADAETPAEAEIVVGNKSYAELKEQSVELIVNVLNRSIDIARNEVKPLIQELVGGYSSDWSTTAAQLEKGNVTFLPIGFSPIWNSPVFLELIDKWNTGEVRDLPLRIRLPFIDELWEVSYDDNENQEKMSQLFLTGIAEIDEHVPSLLENSGNALQILLIKLFGADRNGNVFQHLPQSMVGADTIPLLLLFLVGLHQNTPDQFSGVNSTAEFNTELLNYLNSVTTAAKRLLKAADYQDKTNALIIKAPSRGDMEYKAMGREASKYISEDKRFVCLHQAVYERFLAAGGSDAVIGGWLLGNREEADKAFDLMLERKEMLTKRWETYLTLLKSSANDERLYSFKQYLNYAMRDIISKAVDANNGKDPHIASKEVLMKMLEVELAKIDNGSSLNAPLIIQEIVCNVLYGHTGVPKLLAYLEQAGNSGLGDDGREFALIAAIDYLCNWANANIACR